jgi:hypothetical protein
VLSLSNQHKERLTWVKAMTVEKTIKRNHSKLWWRKGLRNGPRKKTKGFRFLLNNPNFWEGGGFILLSSASSQGASLQAAAWSRF